MNLVMIHARKTLERTGGFTMTGDGVRALLNHNIGHLRMHSVRCFHGPDDGGFAVGAVQGDWEVIEAHQIDDDEIFRDIVLRHYEDFPQCALGAWLSPSTGQIIFDPIMIVNDFIEAEFHADLNNQIAVYDFRKQETVYMENTSTHPHILDMEDE